MADLVTKYKMLVLILFSGALFFTLGAKAFAADPPIPQNTLPSASDFSQGSSVELVTAIYDGVVHFLDAPTATIRLYSPTSAVSSFSIINGGNCPGQGGDSGPNNSQTTTTFFIYSVDPNGANYNNTPYGSPLTLLKTVTNNQIGCNSTFPISSFSSDQAPETKGPQQGKWAFEISAVMSAAGGGGWNQFKYQVAPGDGRLSYYAGSGDHFALKAPTGTSPDNGTFKFGFAPGCSYGDGDPITKPLKWFDEDAGESNQPNGLPYVQTEIIEYDASGQETHRPVDLGSYDPAVVKNGGVTASGHRIINIYSGNNVPGQINIIWLGHHKYEWKQYAIYVQNGIQFELPFDSFNTLINYDTDCATTPLPNPPDAVCSATASPSASNLPPSSSVNISVKTNNTGKVDWNPNSTPSIRMNKIVGGVNQGYKTLLQSSTGSSTVFTSSSGKSPSQTTFTFQATAPSQPNQTKRVIFQMSQGLINFTTRPTCFIDLSSGPPPAGAYLDISCNQSTVRMTSVINATTLIGGVQQRIQKVPAAIIVKDNDDGRNWTYLWPNGVSNGGSSGSESTFGMSNAADPVAANQVMWPHHSYTLTLVLQGSQPPTTSPNAQQPLAYPDDGSWNPTNDANAGTTLWYGTQTFGDYSPEINCLTASCNNTYTNPDVEPGQTTSLAGGIKFTNNTAQQYFTNSTSGYFMHIDVSPGIFGVPGNPADPASTDGPILGGPGSNVVNASFTGRIDYAGTFTVTVMFQGSAVGLAAADGGTVSCKSPNITPATKPFLQVWGGDVNTGGGFASEDPTTGAFSCGSDYPNYVSPASPATGGDPNYGGLKAFGYIDPSSGQYYGSLSDFGALSLGQIAQNTGAKIDFNASPKFANTISPNGQLDASPPAYCATDFYDKTQRTPILDIAPPAGVASLGGSSTDQYIVGRTSPQNVDNFGGGNIPSGRKIALYVNGDITITGNITYDNWDPNDPDTAPSFALIVKGNINIDAGVTRLDGLYVAQPTSPGKDGEFNTCADNTGNQFCVKQFVANGAVIARRIKPLRSVGTVSQDANPNFNPAPGHNPAEIFNYIPSMLLNSPNLNPVYNSLQGIYSLPPVF